MIDQAKKNLISKHQLVLAKKEGKELKRISRAGDAFLHEGNDFYVIKLAIFPFPFYMRKNSGESHKFTLFARRKEDFGETRLQDPIGRGVVLQDLTTHLEIRIPLLKTSLYMNLFPSY